MEDLNCDGYEMEIVPVKAAPDKKSGITFKGNSDGYLEAHRIIKAMTGTKGDRFIKNGVEMTILDTPKNKPIKVEIKLKNCMSGKANLKIFEINRNGGATMMVQKVSGGDFGHVKTLGLKVLKHLIDGVIEGNITEEDIENCRTKISRKNEMVKSKSVNREYKSYLCSSCEKTFTTLQGLNIHVGYIHRSELNYKCDICKHISKTGEELKEHKLSSHTVSKKIKIDMKEQVNPTGKLEVQEIEIQVTEKDLESMMDIDTEVEANYLEKRNDEKIIKQQRANDEEEERKKLEKRNEKEVEKKRKRQMSTDKRRKKKSLRKNKSKQKIEKDEKIKDENETERGTDSEKEENAMGPGYMGWQIDEEGDGSKNRMFLAFQTVVTDLRSDYSHLKEKVEGLEKSSVVQKNDFAKLSKDFNSLKNEYKECVEVLRKETEERTKAETTVKVLKEILESKEEVKNEENMEIDDALGVWITQQKRKPLKINQSVSKVRKCNSCDKTFSTETDLSNHSIEHKKDLYVCQSCGKSFGNEYDVQIHSKEHKTTIQISCDKCDMKFSSKEQLSRHEANHDASHKFNCECADCDRKFEAKINFNHPKTTHSQVEEHKCCKCDKTYSAMSKLRRHDWRSHRKIDCNICGEHLESRDQISTHRKLVHKMFKRIKCKFFPNCLDEDECFFVHEEHSSAEITDNKICLQGENCKNQSCEFSEKEHRTVNKSFLGSRSQSSIRK